MWRRYLQRRREENPWVWQDIVTTLKCLAIPAYLFGIPIWMKYGLDREVFHNKWHKSWNLILTILRIGLKNGGATIVVELHYLFRAFVRQVSGKLMLVVLGFGGLIDIL